MRHFFARPSRPGLSPRDSSRASADEFGFRFFDPVFAIADVCDSMATSRLSAIAVLPWLEAALGVVVASLRFVVAYIAAVDGSLTWNLLGVRLLTADTTYSLA